MMGRYGVYNELFQARVDITPAKKATIIWFLKLPTDVKPMCKD
jgi:hypothetical protein